MSELIPAEIHAGVSLELRLHLPERPAPDWLVELLLRGAGDIDLTATALEEDHSIAVSAVQTAAWVPGRYWWQLRASNSTDTVLVEAGDTIVHPDLSTVPSGYDGRGHAERVLEAIEAVIEGRATIDQQSYQINNRSLSRTPIADLMRLRSHYRNEVARHRSRRWGRRVKVSFC